MKADITRLTAEAILVSVSGDIWGENGVSLFAVLVHWISPEWQLQSRLVCCEPYGKVAHTGDNIFATTKKRLAEVGVGRLTSATEASTSAGPPKHIDTVMESIFAKVCLPAYLPCLPTYLPICFC